MTAQHSRADDLKVNERILYAFGHLVASLKPDHPHHADSGELADDVLHELGLTESEIKLLELVAEHVAGDYEYTGAATETYRAIVAGKL